MIQVYAFRHPESVWNKLRKFQGQFDISLSCEGREWAKRVSHDYLQHIEFTDLWSSDLRRCSDFAYMVAQYCDIPLFDPVVLDPDLRERHFGIYQGISYDEPPYHIINLEEIEGGESSDAMFKRVQRIPKKIEGLPDGAILGIFTSAGVIDRLYAVLANQPYESVPPIANGRYHYFGISKSGEVLENRLNCKIEDIIIEKI